jgi:hypothetical protein
MRELFCYGHVLDGTYFVNNLCYKGSYFGLKPVLERNLLFLRNCVNRDLFLTVE